MELCTPDDRGDSHSLVYGQDSASMDSSKFAQRLAIAPYPYTLDRRRLSKPRQDH